MEPTAQRGNLLLYLLLIFLAVLLGLGGYYLGLRQVGKISLTPPRLSLLAGFSKAQDLLNKNKDLIVRSGVQISYQGTLKNIEPGRSWTLEKNGKTVTVRHEGGGEVKYFHSLGKPGRQPKPAQPTDIKLGDDVSITTSIDPQTGTVSVISIILQSPPPPRPTPTPQPQTP